RREARAAAQLHHTNIVPVFGVGEHDAIHFYAMQFIQGQGLEVVLQEVKRLRGRKDDSAVADSAADRSLAGSAARGLMTGQFVGGLDQVTEEVQTGRPSAASVDQTALSSATGLMPNPTEGITSISGAMPEAEYFRSVARIGVQVAE